ncbi:extracellular solute-binding protein [Brachybacterium hainanense]|uniref:Extracellular solute-binding protein n=1 Tax=Brachybacterium hainanense TaxID=1541174 RepID=A0ABV6RED4_9MICO
MFRTPISRRRLGALGLTALAAGGALSACSGSSKDGAVTWATWGSPEDLKSYDRFQEAFAENHPEVPLDFQPTASYDEYHSKLLTQLSSGKAPDVFYVGDDYIASFIRNDVLLPVDDLIAGEGSPIAKDDFAASLLEVSSKDGVLYGLPNDVNPDTLWYDKEALAAAGVTEDPATLAENDAWTTDAYFDMTAKLAAAGLTGAVYYNYWATHGSFMTAEGGKVYDEAGAYVAHEDPLSIQAMDRYAERFVSKELVLAEDLPEGSGPTSMLVTHKLGFFAAGRYTIASLEGAGVNMDSYDIVRWPTPDGKAAPTGVAASYLAINKKAADPEAAFTFFSEFLSAEGQRLRLETTGTAVPSITGADDLVTDAGFPAHAQTMLDMRDIGFSNFPTEAAVPGLSAKISVDLMNPLYQGKADAATTLQKVADLVAEETA